MSLNDYCARTLAVPSGNAAELRSASGVVQRAAELFGEALVGVAAYGSWTRGEAARHSDVDVLVVLEPRIEITRALYRRWDAVPIAWETHPVEPHFVHLLAPDGRASGLWAEVAVDGIVLFERRLRLSMALVRVRRDILAGRLVRRMVHGQPYWAEAS